jgi:hypothetical protein
MREPLLTCPVVILVLTAVMASEARDFFEQRSYREVVQLL